MKIRTISVLLMLCCILVSCVNNKSPGNEHPNISSGENAAQAKNAQPEMTITDMPSAGSPLLSSALKIGDYFPFKKDQHKKFKGSGNEYAAFETYVDYVFTNTIQLRNINGGTVAIHVYQLSDGILKKKFSQEESYFRYDFTAYANQDEIILKEPLQAGTSWTLTDGSTRTITSTTKKISVPYGSFDTIEVTTKSKESTTRSYYGKDIGLMKQEFFSENDADTISSELENFAQNVPYTHIVKLFFPEFEANDIVGIDRNIQIKTNEDMKFKFQKELKTPPDKTGLSKVLTTNTEILNLKLDNKNDNVSVDLSSHFLTEMNAGSALEGLLLKCITNTFGVYYQKNKVLITLAGSSYESGHFRFKPGEYQRVDENTEPIK